MTTRHVEIMARARHAARANGAFAEFEPALLAVARAGTPEDVACATAQWRDALDADLDRDGSAPATRAEREQERRSFDFSRSIDGKGFGSLTLDPLGAEHVETALRAAYGALHAAADPRTPAQQRADALVEICRTYSGTRDPRANLPTVLVVVDGPTLEGDMVGECRLASGFRIAPDTARRVACDARVQELVVSDTGIPLALGRAARTFSPGQYRALVVRDHHCRARLPRRRRPLRGASPRRMESRPWSNRSRQSKY